MSNYEKLIHENLKKVFEKRDVSQISLRAFAEPCVIKPDGVFISGKREITPVGIIISIYALYDSDKKPVLEPFLSIKDMPGSMLYHGAFRKNVEQVLVPYVQDIYERRAAIIEKMGPDEDRYTLENTGDFSFLLFPLPKIALRYIFYFADEEFPASVTCLFSNNANEFLPMDVLADLAEYTSKKIIEIIST